MQIQVKELSKDYNDGQTIIHALCPCSFSISAGEQIAIIGASGSGKTTLLHLLGGLERPTSGETLFDEHSLFSMSGDEQAKFRRRNIGFVFQAYNLLPELSAEENILLPLMLDGKTKNKEHFDMIAQSLGLTERLRHLPGELSGGQQQRVAIARAVISTPALLLCDEPTGNLDSKNGGEVIRLLTKISEKMGLTLLVVTHDNDIAKRFGRILTLSDGNVGGDV